MNSKDEMTMKKFSAMVSNNFLKQTQQCNLYNNSITARINQTCNNINSVVPNIPSDKKKSFVIQLGKNILKAKGKNIDG